MTETPNLNLILDNEDDNYDIRKFNENFTTIDESVTKIKDETSEILEDFQNDIKGQIGQLRFFVEDGVLCIDDGEE